ncbi:TPA: transposase [Candidatus Woesearchaeota archaeon]|nr:transposase [Candidatus Woesearchaeota archaeon]
MEQQQMELRKQRGYEIAKTSRIEKTDKGWKVPSQSGGGHYIVISNGFGAECNCPDHELRKCKCKHIWAVELIVTKQIDQEGNVTITQTIRKTYSQDWKNYNLAQQKEKEIFMNLLADLTSRINNKTYEFGRPSNNVSDTIYSMVFKVYSTFSGRRFSTDLEIAKDNGFAEQKIPYNSMFRYFQKKELTPLLANMVAITSLPLRSVETKFAIDSTGFGTSNFQRWYSFKHGKEISSRRWVKCHFMTGVKSNIITSVSITSEFDNDSPELKKLVNATAQNFNMEEISADKAYLSKDNLEHIEEKGAMPFIPFKKNNNATGKGAIWKKMYYYFQLNNEDFLEHYHKRSNAETTVHMIKSKFGDFVRSKEWTAQINEVLCKIICHNIYCVIQEMFTLGIEANFVREVSHVSENSTFKGTYRTKLPSSSQEGR